MPFDAADLAAFVDTDMPGYELATIGAASVAGLFRAAPIDALGIIQAARYSFVAATTAVSAATVGTSITINATAYSVAEVMDTSNGMTTLLLKT